MKLKTLNIYLLSGRRLHHKVKGVIPKKNPTHHQTHRNAPQFKQREVIWR